MKMLYCFLFCLAAGPARAQGSTNNTDSTLATYPAKPARYYRHDVTVALGDFSTDHLLNGNRATGVPTRIYRSESHTATVSLTYRYYLRPGLALTAGGAYERGNGQWYDVQWKGLRNPTTTYIGQYKRRVYTFAAGVACNYYRHPRATLYGAAAIGISYQNEVGIYDELYYNMQYLNGTNRLKEKQVDNSRLHANFHVTAIGIRGAGRVGLQAELGFGYKGIVNAGLFVKLHKVSTGKKI